MGSLFTTTSLREVYIASAGTISWRMFFLRIPLFLPFHRVLMHLSKFLCFGRSRSKAPAPAPADSRDPDRVSSSHSHPAAHVSAPRPESSPHGTRLSTSVIIKYSPSQLIPPLHPPPALCLVARLPNPIMHRYRLLRVQYPMIHIWSSLNISALTIASQQSLLSSLLTVSFR
jgi:hypothetical protein